MTDRVRLRRRAGWRSRWFDTILADVKGVDSGSLDVLLYCADDLAVAAPSDSRLGGAADGP